MEQLEFALQVIVLGFSVVLLTLFLLYLIIYYLGRILSPPEMVTSRNLNFAPDDATPGLSPGMVAAITASIYAYLGYDGSTYTIKSIQPVQNKVTGAVSAWVMQGRKDMVNAREEIERYRRDKKWL